MATARPNVSLKSFLFADFEQRMNFEMQGITIS